MSKRGKSLKFNHNHKLYDQPKTNQGLLRLPNQDHHQYKVKRDKDTQFLIMKSFPLMRKIKISYQLIVKEKCHQFITLVKW